jgi:hypothetical protein
MTHYHVIENTPGYMPDDPDPSVFTSKRDAQAYAQELAESLREDGYHVSGNRRDGYYGERDANDLGRVIEISDCDEPDCTVEEE